MNRNTLILIIMSCFLLLNTGCSTKEKSTINESISQSNNTKEAKNSINASANILEGDKSEIIVSSGTIPDNLRIVGVKDEKNFYCCESDNKNIYIYNVEKGTKSVFISTVSPKKYMKTVCVNDKWILWVEDEVKV